MIGRASNPTYSNKLQAPVIILVIKRLLFASQCTIVSAPYRSSFCGGFMVNNPGAEDGSRLARLFEYHQPRFKRTYDEAMADFNKDFAHVRHKFVKRDYANCMHICVRDRVKANFEGLPGAYPVELPKKPFTLIIDGSEIGIDVIAIIIFKKQSESLTTASIQTKAVRDFNTQVTRLSQYVPHIQLALPWPHTQ